MIFVSHRGLWKTELEQNTLDAFTLSFIKRFGCELDLREKDDLDNAIAAYRKVAESSSELKTGFYLKYANALMQKQMLD